MENQNTKFEKIFMIRLTTINEEIMIMIDHKNTKRPDLTISKQAIKDAIIYAILLPIIFWTFVFLIEAGTEESEMHTQMERAQYQQVFTDQDIR